MFPNLCITLKSCVLLVYRYIQVWSWVSQEVLQSLVNKLHRFRQPLKLILTIECGFNKGVLFYEINTQSRKDKKGFWTNPKQMSLRPGRLKRNWKPPEACILFNMLHTKAKKIQCDEPIKNLIALFSLQLKVRKKTHTHMPMSGEKKKGLPCKNTQQGHIHNMWTRLFYFYIKRECHMVGVSKIKKQRQWSRITAKCQAVF